MTRFSDPHGRTIFEGRREDGATYLEYAPGQYRCDFCAAPDPTWEYDCAPVKLVGHQNFDETDDEWAACEDCRKLIDAGDVGGLVERMIIVQGQQPLAPGWHTRPVAVQRRFARQNVTTFLATKRGDARPIRS